MSKNVNNLLSTYDERFLNQWANAVEKNDVTFTYKFKRYNTKGGTSVK